MCNIISVPDTVPIGIVDTMAMVGIKSQAEGSRRPEIVWPPGYIVFSAIVDQRPVCGFINGKVHRHIKRCFISAHDEMLGERINRNSHKLFISLGWGSDISPGFIFPFRHSQSMSYIEDSRSIDSRTIRLGRAII